MAPMKDSHNRQPAVLSLLLIIGLVLGFHCPLHAQESGSLVSEYLLKEGRRLLKSGEKDKAVHQFSKALLANPKNEEAKKQLEELGINSSVYGQPESPLSRVNRLTEEVDKYKDRVAALEVLNEDQKKQNQLLAAEKDKLIMVIAAKESRSKLLMEEIDQLAEEVKYEQQEAENLKELSRDHIAQLNTDIFELKNQLSSKLDVIKTKDEKIKKVQGRANEWRQKMKIAQKSTRRAQITHTKEVRSIKKDFNRFKSRAASSDLEKEKMLNELNDVIYRKNREIAQMGDKLVFHNEKIITSREQTIAKEKKIQELKDALYVLEDEVNTLRAEMREQRRLQRLSSETVHDEKDSADLAKIKTIERQDKLIAELKTKLAKAKREDITIEEAVFADREGRIDALNEEIRTMKSKLRIAERALEQKSNEYDLIEARLQDTQQRLELVNQMLEDRDTQIHELEEQITGALNQFDDKL